MRRQSILALSVLVLLTVLVIAAIWTQVIPQYQARAEVRVRSVIPRLVFRTEDNGRIPRYRSFVNTQASIMKNPAVLQRALDKQEVQETQWYKSPPKSLVQRLRGNPADPPMERLRDALSVRPRPRTEIIDIAFDTSDAKDAKLIVNSVLEQYIKYIGEMSDATSDKLYRQLVEQYKRLETEIVGIEKMCADFRKSLGTGTPQELISARRVRLDATQARLSELRQNIAVLEWDRKQLEDLVKQATTGDGNEPPVDATGGMEHQLARAKHEEQVLCAESKKQQAEFQGLFDSAQLLEKENSALAQKRELFDAVRQRLDQKNMERNVPGPIDVLNWAVSSSEPYSDRRVLFTVIAFVLCLGMGSSMVFLLRRRITEGDKSQQT